MGQNMVQPITKTECPHNEAASTEPPTETLQCAVTVVNGVEIVGSPPQGILYIIKNHCIIDLTLKLI